MRNKKKSLSLNRETLKTLVELDHVVGAGGQRTNETGCTAIGCPSDRCPTRNNCPTQGFCPTQTCHTGCSVLAC